MNIYIYQSHEAKVTNDCSERYKEILMCPLHSRLSPLPYRLPVLQLGFVGRGMWGRALFVQSYKNEGTNVSCDMLNIKTQYSS